MSESKGFWQKGYLKAQWRMFKAEAGAVGRQGLKDARGIVMGPWGGGVEEPGTPGNPTQQMVTEAFEGKDAQGNDGERAKAQRADGQSKGRETLEQEGQDKVDKALLRKREKAHDGPAHA